MYKSLPACAVHTQQALSREDTSGELLKSSAHSHFLRPIWCSNPPPKLHILRPTLVPAMLADDAAGADALAELMSDSVAAADQSGSDAFALNSAFIFGSTVPFVGH